MQSKQATIQPHKQLQPQVKGASKQDVHNAVKALVLTMQTQEAQR